MAPAPIPLPLLPRGWRGRIRLPLPPQLFAPILVLIAGSVPVLIWTAMGVGGLALMLQSPEVVDRSLTDGADPGMSMHAQLSGNVPGLHWN